MRAAGCSYRVIAESLGRGTSTIMYHLSDQYREKTKAYERGYRKTARGKKNHAASNRKYYESERYKSKTLDPAFRVNSALRAQRSKAKLRGYSAPACTVDEVLAAYDGKCYLCGVPECECASRFHIEHNHKTGEFRGWACSRCNTLIGYVENFPDLIDRFREMHDNEYSTPQS